MQMAYGSYSWLANSAEITTGSATKYDASGLPHTLSCWIRVAGVLSCSSEYDADNQSNAMYGAMNTPFQDFVVSLDNTNTSSLRLRNADSFSGVRVTEGPNFPKEHGSGILQLPILFLQGRSRIPSPRPRLVAPTDPGLRQWLMAGGGGPSGAAFSGGWWHGQRPDHVQRRNRSGRQANRWHRFSATRLALWAAAGQHPQCQAVAGPTLAQRLASPVGGSLAYGSQSSSLPGGLTPGQFPGLVITDFHESVTTQGGGPTYIYLPAFEWTAAAATDLSN